MSDFRQIPPDPGPDDFERQLMNVMRRVDAPIGFAARVVECATTKRRPSSRIFAPLRGLLTAAAVSAVAICIIAFRVHVSHEREQAALAQQQFDVAARVTGHALDEVREGLENLGLKLGE